MPDDENALMIFSHDVSCYPIEEEGGQDQATAMEDVQLQ
jgi:hypothetical protein